MGNVIRALYAQLSKRPILALTISYVGVQFVAAVIETYRDEKVRANALVNDTLRDLDEWADEIEKLTAAKMRLNAEYSKAAQSGGEAPS